MKAVEYLRGRLTVRCDGGFPERILNSAAEKSIPLKNVKQRDFSLFFDMDAADYAELRGAARYAQTRMKIVKKSGLIFALRRRPERLSTIIGVAAFMLFLSLLCGRIWFIEVKGGVKADLERVRETVGELGVTLGARRDKLDTEMIKNSAYMELGDISWMTINLSDGFAAITVHDKTELPDFPDSRPCDLGAARDGVITRLNVLEGYAAVQCGDTVHTGDVLVSCQKFDKSGKLHTSNVSGSVTARTEREMSFFVPYSQLEVSYRERENTGYALWFADSRVEWGAKSAENDFTRIYEYRPVLFGMELPFGAAIITCLAAETETEIISALEAKDIAEKLMAEYELSELDEVLIIKRNVSVQAGETGVTLFAEYICEENIAVFQPAQLDIVMTSEN